MQNILCFLFGHKIKSYPFKEMKTLKDIVFIDGVFFGYYKMKNPHTHANHCKRCGYWRIEKNID